ncbi:MAG TPA: hypothetical protein DCS07_12660 [Bdellovibrionales bacterium]|nr:hypothetical protein [Bdellovibrionales bacterium]
MSQFRTVQLSLRIHSLLICSALLLLTAFLGWKVFSIAQTQAGQMRALVRGDFRAQALLQTIEAKQESVKSANRKYWITRDNNYAALVDQEVKELGVLRKDLLEAITIAHPQFTASQIEDTEGTKRKLEVLLLENLAERQEAATGISKHVLFAVALSVVISLWVSDLFFRRLGTPLKVLKAANSQIARGNLDYRIPESSRAVSELTDLSCSFNRMAARLQELDRTKYEFFSEVSHQIKNPLAALKEGLDLFASGRQDLSENSRRKAIAACLIATKRLETMIENLMQHARIERGFKDFRMEHADLGELVEAAMVQVQPLAEKNRIALHFTPSDSLQGRLSTEGMSHVIENLLMNAIRYGEENSTVNVKACRVEGRDALSLRVSNRAKLLPSCEPSRLFDRFYRGNPAEQPSGFGLGLYIVKSIVEAHRGRVHAQCDQEANRFTVQLEISVSEGVV